MDMLTALWNIRPSFGRVRQVLYQAPGFLHGTYMLQKRGPVTQGDLIQHAITMRYGDGDAMLVEGEAQAVAMMIKVLEVR